MRNVGIGVRQTWVQIPAPLLAGVEFLFSHLHTLSSTFFWGKSTNFVYLLGGSETVYVKHLG